jgi:hypothetical protein
VVGTVSTIGWSLVGFGFWATAAGMYGLVLHLTERDERSAQLRGPADQPEE